jgi:ATP-dependent Clp endopeptidase proteolytic subunit ClpP
MPNFTIECKEPRKAVVKLYDQIGPSWAGMIDATLVSNAINDAGPLDSIEVRINCPGGSLYEGMAIYNILKAHPASVHTAVDGIAASMGSVVLLAGDTREVPKNAFVMIHDPSIVTAGVESDLLKAISILSKGKQAIIDTYAERTGQSPESLAKMMSEETWMNGEEAVAKGFATSLTKELSVPKAVEAATLKAFAAYGFSYTRAPQQLSSLFSLTMSSTRKEPEPMADTKTADQITAEATAAAELKAKQDADAAKSLADKALADIANAADTERKRSADIIAVCNQAGKADLAAEFITNKATLADVQAHLLKVLCNERKPMDDAGTTQTQTADPNAAYKAEYAKSKDAYAKAGVTEDDFVKSRRIDDGLDPLQKLGG